ncbi:MAG: hypothetical protein HeimC3_13120 [Candidatus Heimdallarchaeota archaeon LC_3]|nr:MAG: hypothetical protein HeimC3_13120 [Candidatus Heimdallarchaeota archaeon LC_3]
MTLYDRFLERQSDPETLIRWGAYIFILIWLLNSLTANLFAFNNLLDVQNITGLTDAKLDLVENILLLNIWSFLIAFLPFLLSGIGALAFLNLAFDEDLLIWLRMVSLIAVVVLLFGSFLF